MALIEYSGKDNLDVMRGARNYNDYLTRLVAESVGPNDVVVDFGAGAGTFAKSLAFTGSRIVCVETDPDLAGSLRQQGFDVYDAIDALPDGGVDCIYSLNVLEHIDDDRAVLESWHRKLRSGGRFTIYVPAFPVLFTAMDRKVGHVRRYTKTDLVGKVRAAGFDLTRSCYADSLGYFATLAYKFLGNDDGSVNERMLLIYDRYVFPLSRLLDRATCSFLGKNLLVTGVKRDRA